MKLKVNKRWWQFWLPSELEVDLPVPRFKVDVPPTALDSTQHVSIVPEHTYEPSAIEANEAEPWYNSEPSASDSVVTAEPDLVAKNRGNATMRERMNGQ